MNTQLTDIAVIPPLPGKLPDGTKTTPGADDNPAGDAFSTAFAKAKVAQSLRPPGHAMPNAGDPAIPLDPANALDPATTRKPVFASTDESADAAPGNPGLIAADPALDLALLQSMRDQTGIAERDPATESLPQMAEAALADAPPAPPFTVALPAATMLPPAAPVPSPSRAGKEPLPAAAPAPGSAFRPTPGEVLSDLGAGMRAAPTLGASLSGSTAAAQERGFEAALAKLETGATPGSAATPVAPILSPLAASPLTALAPQRLPEAPPPVTATVHAPLPSPAFPEEAAQRLTWLVKNGVESASLRVTPADMGPIEIRIRLTQDEATIAFAVTQPESGRAIEDAMPRLREMLSENGISLGHTSVESGNGGQFAADEERARLLEAQQLRGARNAAQATATLPAAVAPSRGVGLVDLFA